MNKKIFKLLTLLSLISCGILKAREFRTPLSIFNVANVGYNHALLTWPIDDDCGCWHWTLWGAGLYRATDRAFRNKNTTKTESLAGIFFCKETFMGSDAFSPDTPAEDFAGDPFLVFAEITPRFDYHESTAMFGFAVERPFGCDCLWNGGLRGSLPFRAIKVELDSCCDLAETLPDVCRQDRERILDPSDGMVNPIQNPCYTYRLDFLSALFIQQSGSSGPLQKLVEYVKPTPPGPPPPPSVRIADRQVGVTPADPVRGISLIQRDDGTPSTPPWCTLQATVDGLPEIGANGEGPGNNNRANFSATTDYTPLSTNIPAQRRFWILPTLNGLVNDISDDAKEIKRQIDDAILNSNLMGSPAIQFFQDNGIDFNTQRNYGVGDLELEIYANRCWCDLFGEAIFGVIFPTGNKIKDPGKLLLVPTGSNGHFQIKAGLLGQWQPTDWFVLKVDAAYFHAIKRTERVAAPFAGATVKNIGPPIDAKISWNWFLGDIDFTFMVPCICPELGVDVGYQAYVKSKDKVSLDQTTATDFLGNDRPLDPDVLECRTFQVAHRVKSEIFHQACNWQLFAGFTHVFAGENITRDSDWYLGLKVYW